MGPKGGDPRAPSAPFGGMGPWGPWGHCEAIPHGKPFRVEGSFEMKAVGGLEFEVVPEMFQNGSETNHLEHLGSLGPERVQNDTKN